MSRSLLVVAGEISGDLHAAAVVRKVRLALPGLRIWGVGGDALAAEGVELRRHTRDMAVMGLAEVLKRYGFFRKALRDLSEEARRNPPDVALLVDYPGFNFRLAAKLHPLRTRIVYYVCPQVWAWRRSRIRQMAGWVDRLQVIFPFEEPIFREAGIQTEFVGHPLVEEARAALLEPDADLPWSGSSRIALLPGSREQEVARLLPVLAAAAWWLRKRRPETSFLVASPTEEMAVLQRRKLRQLGSPEGLLPVVAGQTRQILKQASAAWVASGTATLEACLM
ncbi:MAG: lipid-A-disaccharide synthase, partial [Kiritimatiellia bacterium]|nr:lipid-A-disaccharide synthase [Kiritimatiellia bacterium]